METVKEEVRRILDLLPDDATLEDVQYRIYVRQAIAAGLRDVDEGRVVSQEEVERRMAPERKRDRKKAERYFYGR